jgi:hypothetical protein
MRAHGRLFVSKVAKIAIGCFIVLFLGGVAVIAGFGGLLWWGKGKLQQVTQNEENIQALQKKANAVPFTRPADGVIAEERLFKFIDVRKRVFSVYEKHRAEFEAIGQKKQADFSDLTKGFGVINEIRAAQAQALADVGMNPDEYAFMVESIYKSAWAAGVADAQGGKSVSEATSEALGNMQKQLEGASSPEAAQALKQLQAAAEQTQALDVPKANIELFKKHEDELKKYAMAGLEFVGL